jgi:hypothetical protein
VAYSNADTAGPCVWGGGAEGGGRWPRRQQQQQWQGVDAGGKGGLHQLHAASQGHKGSQQHRQQHRQQQNAGSGLCCANQQGLAPAGRADMCPTTARPLPPPPRLWGKVFERAAATKADFDAASLTAFLWAASTAGVRVSECVRCNIYMVEHGRTQLRACVCTCVCVGPRQQQVQTGLRHADVTPKQITPVTAACLLYVLHNSYCLHTCRCVPLQDHL